MSVCDVEPNTRQVGIEPFSLKNVPSLIETIFPAQKISMETQKERKSGSSQTLTALGSYWKGRKMLILNKACILGALLPATDDPEMDLVIFEKLMAIDDEAFKRRVKSAKNVEIILDLPYLDRLEKITYRPEELDAEYLFGPIWEDVNRHLGTNAHSFPELVEQLGIMRFGHRPKVADTFCGSGQIPFEAARLGCDVYASDLNPIACMLTWGSLNFVGADSETRRQIIEAQHKNYQSIDEEISSLGIENDSQGNRAKAYLYCLETRCPETGWMVPITTTWVISVKYKTVAKLIPNPSKKCFDIEVVTNASVKEIEEASKGTFEDEHLVYTVESSNFRTPISTIRGDSKQDDNALRRWDKIDFMPTPDDIFQERLYAIQWMTKDTLHKKNPTSYFASVTQEDLERECKVQNIVRENFTKWQAEGLVPDMLIEPGDKTDEPIRTRGWTYWHHLFTPRALFYLSLKRKHTDSVYYLFQQARDADRLSRLCRFNPNPQATQGPKIEQVFSNQALNTMYNYGLYSFAGLEDYFKKVKSYPIQKNTKLTVELGNANQLSNKLIADIWITDPPYADAVQYHEITEFFIAWLRKNPPEPFKDWVWDSRRALAIKGSGEDFRREMVAAYKAMADHMPDNGLQVVMFTHQDAGVWADMAAIVWGAGLQVTAAWYIATETTSELKKGGYVQGTVLLVLRKRLTEEAVYQDELVQEVREEVARQLETMVGLNQAVQGHGRAENLFEDADLQMAGYAAALRVLTGYAKIDGRDMTAEALRPRVKGERNLVGEIIDFAVQVANEHLVPEGILPTIWESLTGSERFYLKMLDIESAGLKKLDNYQNFAKAFRVGSYPALMASTKANASRLKTGFEFKKSEFEGEFGQSKTRALLYALYELQKEVDSDEVMGHLRDLVQGYHNHRETLKALAGYISAKREKIGTPEAMTEAESARILLGLFQHERL